jgi:hypothetical protein
MSNDAIDNFIGVVKKDTLNSLRNRVGYRESDNREEFMKGAKMALEIAIPDFRLRMKRLSSDVDREAHYKDIAIKDIRTLVDILDKYHPSLEE